MDPRAIHLVALGGAGEIGMNLNLYHHAGRWLMVDCGVLFERQGHEQRVWMPDPSFVEARRDRLDALVLTHAHMDHIGAVAALWPRLRCRVYATRFCVEMLRGALREAGLEGEVPIQVLDEHARFEVGPFELQRLPMTHSTVEMGALVIRTAAGTVLHTGDFKLDAHPVEGALTEIAGLQALADHGVDAVVSDSTNADVEGWTPSEGSLVEPLTRLLADRPHRVVVTFFASNVARIRTLFEAGLEVGRHPVMLGRSLDRTFRAARAAGYLEDLPEPVPTREYGFLPRERVLLLCTGSQGEPQAALSKLAADQRTDVYLEAGDAVVFGARRIPGNEVFLERVEAQLRERGIDVVTPDDAHVHVSGHPRRDELRTLYRWVRPRAVVPVHGTPTKLEAHAALAEAEGLEAGRIHNGDVLRLAPGPLEIVDRVATGRLDREAR